MLMNLSLNSLLPAVDRGLKSMKAECDLPSCHHKQLLRSIPGSRPGMRMGQSWYCSIDCFAFALRGPFAMLSARRVVEIPRNPRLSLGLVMHSKGYLTAEQLRIATAQSQSLGEELAATVIRLGMATEKQVSAARSAQWGFPALAQDYIGKAIQADLPRSILRACSAAPLHYSASAKRMLLGFTSRVEHCVLEAIEQMTECRVEACFITPTEFEEQMERLTHFPDYEEITADGSVAPEKMARAVGRVTVEVGGREARYTQYKNYVWVRVLGKRGTADVVFRVNQAVEGAVEGAIEDGKGKQSENFYEPIANLG
jgi:hypothetical protein